MKRIDNMVIQWCVFFGDGGIPFTALTNMGMKYIHDKLITTHRMGFIIAMNDLSQVDRDLLPSGNV